MTLKDVSGTGTIAISINAGTAKDKAGNLADILSKSEETKLDTDLPQLNEISIKSNNANTAYAKNEDFIIITFNSNEEITPVVKIQDRVAYIETEDNLNFTAIDFKHGFMLSLPIAVVILAESLLGESSFAIKNNYKIKENREILAFSLLTYLV